MDAKRRRYKLLGKRKPKPTFVLKPDFTRPDAWDPQCPVPSRKGIKTIFSRRDSKTPFYEPKGKSTSTPRSPHVLKPHGQSKTSFLSLPGELRNRIYSLHLPVDSMPISGVLLHSPSLIFRGLLHHPLFRVCRQIRQEALSYYLSRRQCLMFDALSTAYFLKYIGPIGRQHLKELGICCYGPLFHPLDSIWGTMARLLGECTSLKRITIEHEMPVIGISTGELERMGLGQRTPIAELVDAFQGMEGVERRWHLVKKGALHGGTWPYRLPPEPNAMVRSYWGHVGGEVRIREDEVPPRHYEVWFGGWCMKVVPSFSEDV